MILPIIWVLLGVVLLGFYNGLLLKDDKLSEDDPQNKKIESYWHFVGSLIFIYLALTTWYVWDIKYIPLTLSSFWCLFGGIVHKVGLNKPFFFVGTTAKTDKLLRKVFPKNPELLSGIVKIATLVISILFVIFK